MMKSIIPKNIEIIAFDMDGTLYDEFDFISQAYRAVAQEIEKTVGMCGEKIYQALCETWLEVGSSGNVFQVVCEKLALPFLTPETLERCIFRYRNCSFSLSVSIRVKTMLEMFEDYKLFIITDGDSILQRRKYDALALHRWIDEKNVIVSGDYGKEYQKPAPYMGQVLIAKVGTGDGILYFGDRRIDKEFAANSGFTFRQVKSMQFI